MERTFLFRLALGVVLGKSLGQGMKDRFATSTPGAGDLTGMLLSSLGMGQSHDGSRDSQQLMLLSSFS